MDIGHYIKEILKYEESVIVTELGAFTARYRPARVDPKTKSVSPPSKEISFIEKLKKDNGRLVRFISEKESITETEARHEINEFVKKTIVSLNSGNHVRINGLGYLYKDKAYKVQFVQDQGENILLDSFGLEEIEWDTGSAPGKVKTTTKQAKKTKGKVLILPIAILAVIVLVLAMLIADKVKLNDEEGSIFSTLFSEDYDGETTIPDKETAREVLKNIDSLRVKEHALHFEEDMYAKYRSFYIIAGSFSIYNNAEKMRTQLADQGYNAEVLEVDGKIFRVSMKKFSNRNEAIKELQRLQKIHREHSLWVLSSMQ